MIQRVKRTQNTIGSFFHDFHIYCCLLVRSTPPTQLKLENQIKNYIISQELNFRITFILLLCMLIFFLTYIFIVYSLNPRKF